jgi:hypothetical protein
MKMPTAQHKPEHSVTGFRVDAMTLHRRVISSVDSIVVFFRAHSQQVDAYKLNLRADLPGYYCPKGKEIRLLNTCMHHGPSHHPRRHVEKFGPRSFRWSFF